MVWLGGWSDVCQVRGRALVTMLAPLAEEMLVKVDSLRKSNKEIERNRRAVSGCDETRVSGRRSFGVVDGGKGLVFLS